VRYSISVDGKPFEVEISASGNGWQCRLNGREVPIEFVALNNTSGSLLINGRSFELRRQSDKEIFIGARKYEVTIEDPRSWQGRKRRESSQTGSQRLTTSMPGKVVRILAREGDEVQAGQGILVIEAMKMQNEIRSPKSGRLQKVMVREGANVNPGEALAIVN
jgi:biotin carboxyl carrier protein